MLRLPFLFDPGFVRDYDLVVNRVIFRRNKFVEVQLPELPLFLADYFVNVVQISVDVVSVAAVLVEEVVKL